MDNNTVHNISDIARLAGVSESTVSRALHDNPLISEKTRRRIQSIAREHNFHINARARNFRLKKTHTVAAILTITRTSGQGASDPFLLQLVGTIAEVLTENNYDLLITTAKSFTADLALSYVKTQKSDGVIIFGQNERHDELLKLQDSDIPFVVWGTDSNDFSYVTVGSDNRKGGYLATLHLMKDRQRKRVYFVGDTHHLEAQHRYEGYLRAHQELGVTPPEHHQVLTPFCIETGNRNVAELLERDPSVDGLVCSSDSIALGAIKAIESKNLRIPEDISVVGYDNVAVGAFSSPRLTTINQDTTSGGRLLVEKVMALIDGRPVEPVRMEPELIIRESC